ncbi:histidine--tRNA ligase [Sulfurimonas diazotrophicus]|uniref:Histidine--tRNA ligase n=1 Tax=Sulfurimonas diazotrophicus TaxID=3131939 RepID=A0ABZ3HC03_9BACT
MIRSLRGMNDILPPDNVRFEYFLETATAIARRYGFSYVETPLLEETTLFKRSVGESSDIVGKEMYQFIDKGENDVCLRPEGTAGVVRAFVQNKLDRAGGIHRYFYHGPMFRYERPQKGRLREFHQFGCESFGVDSVYEDVTIITMIADILTALGISFRLKINSLGDQHCMPQYREMLVGFLDKHEEHICEDCARRKATNPIRVLDCKNDKCQILYQEAPKLMDNLCEACESDFATLKQLLDEGGIAYEVDTHLVRGLDYYSKTAFEFVSDEIGAQSAVAGGGRYDRLVEFLDGRATPAVGFAIGIERLLELIKMPEALRHGYYMGAMDAESLPQIMQLARDKRTGDTVVVEYAPKGLKAHLKGADRINARYCVVIGENERNEGKVWIKDLETKTESVIPADQL